MTLKNIPTSIKEIINVFIRNNFNPLTYKSISKVLKKDTNAIVQRIKRNEDYFVITGKRPYQISLKTNLKEIYFYRDKNQCRICRKSINPEELLLRFKDSYMKDKYDWNNCFTCCQKCKDKEIAKKTRKKRTRKNQVQKKGAWEYKEVYIKKIFHTPLFQTPEYLRVSIGSWERPIEKNLTHDYYEFNELNGDGWFHLIDDDKNISSKIITDILDYFGDDEWELVSITKISGNNKTSAMDYLVNYTPVREEQYQCIFKRKMRGD